MKNTKIEQLTKNIIHVTYSKSEGEQIQSVLICEDFMKPVTSGLLENNYIVEDEAIYFINFKGDNILKAASHTLTPKQIYKYYVEGEPIQKKKMTANGEVVYIENAKTTPSEMSYEGRIVFEVTSDEYLYGLGQHEDGVLNYNGKTEYLYQTNMKISIPFLLSTKNYGILIDTESAMIYESKDGKVSFTIDTTDYISYYVIVGDCFDEIIYELRNLTGKAPMLPRWAFGYVQSKERYKSTQELIETVEKFRQQDIPIDCIVQDWHSWNEGLWGDKHVDKSRYPDLHKLTEEIHNLNAKLMVSIWPNMAEGSQDLEEFKRENLLLPNSTTYDAFDERARELYWKQCNNEWFSSGIDAWWCDNAEPFSDADWNGETKREEHVRYQLIVDSSKQSMNWRRLNSYGLLHSKGIYENWRASNSDKRVVNLTRSTYISGQRYSAIAWSGDIAANWPTLKRQITEGIKYCLSGMPYWTLDIGAFFVVKDKWENRGCNCKDRNVLWFWDGHYNDGVEDLGYRELYVRWLQLGIFLPMFRSHGTDTPREPWNFGTPGTIFYDTILKFIKLRYSFMPYIYSLSADIYFNNSTMLRGLMFDFAGDKNVHAIDDSFMFGKAFLVSPVTEPMYYSANSEAITSERVKDVYLPAGCKWYDFWTNEVYEGGQTIKRSTPLDIIPLYVKAGSIIPTSEPLMYADQKGGEVSEILVYGGSNGEFTLYNDEGDNYSYENENYSAVDFKYCDGDRTLLIGAVRGTYKFQRGYKITLIEGSSIKKTENITYEGKEVIVKL